jgi:hypothetical protein
MLSENGYIFILDGEGNYISEQVMYINIGRDGTCDVAPVYSSSGILEVEVEVEVPITYTTDITFDECCNIIGEFEGISSIDGDISNEGEGPNPEPGGLNNIIIYFLENNKDCNLPETCLNETEINSILEKLGLDLL